MGKLGNGFSVCKRHNIKGKRSRASLKSRPYRKSAKLADHLSTYTLKPNGKIQVQVMLGRRSDGKPNRKTKTFDKKGDAVIWANQQVAKYYGGSAPSQQLTDILFEDVAVNCFRDLHERMLLATRTEELYLSNYRLHILPLLKGRTIGSVNGRLLTECLDRIKLEKPGRPLTRTVTIVKTVLHYIFDYAYKQHFLTNNPMLYVTLPQQTVF